MTEEQSIIIDILEIVPDNSICYINAPSIDEGSGILKILVPSNSFDWSLTLSADNKIKFENIIKTEGIQHSFHRLDIEFNKLQLCESYDGMCTVILTDNLNIPEWFTNKYAKEGNCWSMK
jgi:hypothetical protein